MTDDRRSQLEALFAELAPASAEDRERRLRELDADLRAELSALLEEHDRYQRDEPETDAEESWFFGDFRMLDQIGEGRTSDVWLAEEPALGSRKVALKVLVDPMLLYRFESERNALTRLKHPNIVTIFQGGTIRNRPYYAMEYVRGSTLRSVLLHRNGPPLATGEPVIGVLDGLDEVAWSTWVLGMGATVAEALHHAHNRGVWHLDIKPENLLIDEQGEPHLIDFGLAGTSEAAEAELAEQGLGTLFYMAPEQIQLRQTVDGRTDIFSLGIVLYECLTGGRPFDGESRTELENAVLHQYPHVPRRLHRQIPWTNRILDRALEKRRAERYVNAGEFARDIRLVLGGEKPRTPPISHVKRVRRFRAAHPSAFRSLETLALILAVLVPAFLLVPRLSEYWQRPRLTVLALSSQGEPIRDASVSLVALDPFARVGEERLETQLPLNDRRVPAGRFRIVVDGNTAGYAELTRELSPRTFTHAIAWLRPDDEVHAEMIRIDEPGPVSVPGTEQLPWERRDSSDPPFYIDKYEVSNGEYRTFLRLYNQAKPADTPSLDEPGVWTDDRPSGWENLPVVGVNYYDARRYAEWAGKRLPNASEWQRAARGPQGWTYPWGDTLSAADTTRARFGIVLPRQRPSLDEPGAYHDFLYRQYLDGVLPVRSLPAGASADGLHHVLGNVEEWTDSMPLAERSVGGVQVSDSGESLSDSAGSIVWDWQEDERLVLGSAWSFSAIETRLDWLAPEETVVREHTRIGFRCAKSVR